MGWAVCAKGRVKENVAKEESSLKEDKDEEKDEVKTNASEKDDENTNNDDTPSSNKTLVAALPEFLKTKSIAIPGLNNCQANLLLKLAAYYETGDSNLYYGRCAPLDKHHGIAAGYVDLTVNQGSVGRVVKKYAESLPENTKNPFANYMELLADTAAGLTNPDDIVYFNGFCEVWQTVSEQPAFRAAYDSTLLDLYINPTVSAARSLHLTKPLSLTILFDSVLHLGLNVLDTKIIPNITATVAKDGEAVYISQLLILRTQYREAAAEAAKISIENGDEDDWDTAPDSEWKKGLAAYASLIVANGREKEGLMKSLEMSERTLAVAGDVNGTSRVLEEGCRERLALILALVEVF
ncbi:hypothetical protein BC829DRAFT_63594 [Chytridium lagenaria]|nr:hypothetical protein BC829DRAFT_63594 [Chytridium lagenaria]